VLGPISPVASIPVFEHTLDAKRAEKAAHDPATCSLCQAGGHERAAARQASDQLNLSDEARRKVAELAKTDREVRAHEQAHLAAAGAHATSGASYSYVTGPDGQRYAVAGEVSIDSSPVPGDPEATIRKAQTIIAAAHAPADPSFQDRAVAAVAAQMMAKAQAELSRRSQQSAAHAGFLPPPEFGPGTFLDLLA